MGTLFWYFIIHCLTKMIKLHIANTLLSLAAAENTKNYLLEIADQVDSTKSNSERLIGKTIPEARSLIEKEGIFHDGIQVKSIWVLEKNGQKGIMGLGVGRQHGRLNVATIQGRIFRIFDIFDSSKSNSERSIGKTIPEAKSLIKREDIFHKGIKVAWIRVLEKDGKGGPMNLALNIRRLNVATKKGRISKIFHTS